MATASVEGHHRVMQFCVPESASAQDAIDAVLGTNGNNVLNGAGGQDTLTGNAGLDTFEVTSALGTSNVDRLVDFSHADDVIQLDHAIFSALVTGPLDGSAFKNLSTGRIDADDHILYNARTGVLSYDADGQGGVGAVTFANLLNKPADLDASDFFVI
jgi:Ca2+-binding RTX toxin-like protein